MLELLLLRARADAPVRAHVLALGHTTSSVVTIVGMPSAESTVSFNGLELFLDAKEIRVSNMGSSQIRSDFPRYEARDQIDHDRPELSSRARRWEGTRLSPTPTPAQEGAQMRRSNAGARETGALHERRCA